MKPRILVGTLQPHRAARPLHEREEVWGGLSSCVPTPTNRRDCYTDASATPAIATLTFDCPSNVHNPKLEKDRTHVFMLDPPPSPAAPP